MADGDDPFSSLEALLGGGEGENEGTSESDAGSEDGTAAAVDADDPFGSMAALLVRSTLLLRAAGHLSA